MNIFFLKLLPFDILSPHEEKLMDKITLSWLYTQRTGNEVYLATDQKDNSSRDYIIRKHLCTLSTYSVTCEIPSSYYNWMAYL